MWLYLVGTHQTRRGVRRDSHPYLFERCGMAFVGKARDYTARQVGHEAFDHRSAVPTGAGEVPLGGSMLPGQSRLVQESQDIFLGGSRGEEGDRLRNTPHEPPSVVRHRS
jgi:hypothetical protein